MILYIYRIMYMLEDLAIVEHVHVFFVNNISKITYMTSLK